MEDRTPAVSVIALTSETYEMCRRSIGYVARQTIVDQIEMVIVCKDRAELAEDREALAGFHSVKIVELAELDSTGRALAEGVRQASAPIVFYVEEHNFFPPTLCEASVAEMERTGAPALGFAMLPANPGLVAWIHMYAQFGWVVDPVTPGFVDKLGGHHAAYRREILLDFGDDLAPLLGTENVLHEILHARGVRMYLTDQAVVPHVQISNYPNLLLHDFVSQRTYAAARMKTQGWSVMRRMVYAAGMPLLPFLRSVRILGHVIRTRRWRMLLPDALLLFFGVGIAGAAGEAMGYVFGYSNAAAAERFEIETHRYDFLRASDRDRLSDRQSPERSGS